jgi:hypothetical protein
MVRDSAFERCSIRTRSYVFYDLLINLLPHVPEKQTEVTHWAQFQELPEEEQAKLFRLMASKAILRGEYSELVADWIRSAVELYPADIRNRLVAMIYRKSPGLLKSLLTLRRWLTAKSNSDSPFELTSQVQ